MVMAAGRPAADVARCIRVLEQTFRSWRVCYGDVLPGVARFPALPLTGNDCLKRSNPPQTHFPDSLSWSLPQEFGDVVNVDCGHSQTDFRQCFREPGDVVDAGIGQVRLDRLQGPDQNFQLHVIIAVGHRFQS